eukprot:PITA_10297
MQDSKLVKVPILVGVRLSAEQCPKTQEEEEDMSHVPYASEIDSLKYAMVCTRPGITCSGSIEQVYVKTREGALDNSEASFQRLCSSMGLVQGAIRIYCDSQSAIFLEKIPAYHSKTKHIDVQYHFVRDMIEDKKALLVKVETLKNTADALKKYVSSENFSWCRETMGILGLEK